ncbi:MAG: FAD-dependent oxidoreductase [Candidatus Lokiarchaeota archaeon]|nr:FAD-dependent oxidoreductase [Candidatus Lokiarchaeota archaeon]MBD3342636.1 FAD-dependent oxidoreductase [Candidatus Lokiarchaeota archaeon]
MKKLIADVVVIGGGSAGLASAIEVKKAGLDVLVIERDKELGGITLQCIHNGFGLHEFGEELTGPEYVQRFIDEAKDLKIPHLLDTMVIELTPEKVLYAVNNNDGLLEIQAKAIILAMGCRERTRGAINIPGFRPAGIYTAGQAQRFVNMEGYLPGRTFVILGSGDIGMIMARRLTWEGCKVKAVVEINPYVSGLIRNQVQCLEDYNIPLITSHTVTKIHGKERIRGVTISKMTKDYDRIVGSERFIECDTLLLSVGLIPENELTLNAGADLSTMGGPIVDNNLELTIDGIFACGNVLQVHDLVDNVSAEAKRAGQNAVKFIKERYDIKREKEEQIKCVAGENVNYVKPDLINKSDLSKEIIFSLRVKYPDRRIQIEFKDNQDKVFYVKKKVYVIPSEMITLKVNLEEQNIDFKCKEITIEVVPRPEVLIEENEE